MEDQTSALEGSETGRQGIRQLLRYCNWAFVRECGELSTSKKTSVQLVRSFAVSLVALAVDFGTLAALVQKAGMYYLLAATISFCLGVVVNYYLSVWWVFADHKLASKKAEWSVFFIICSIGLGLNLIVIAGLVQLAAFNYLVAKAVSAVVVFFWNFIARKKVLY